MIDFLSISVTNIILIVLLIAVLILFCLYLYIDNRKLKEQLGELRKENKSLLEKKIMKQESIDSISIKNISTEKSNIDEKERLNLDNKLMKEESVSKQEIPKNNYSQEKVNSYTYQDTIQTQNTNFDINELINKNNYTKLNPQPSVNEYDYLKEIQARMNEELKPQTIELTDYEKKQEEQAVISYKELLRFKETNQYNDEKQETIQFIEELKNLRNSLK